MELVTEGGRGWGRGGGTRQRANWSKGGGAFSLRDGQTRDDTTRFCGNLQDTGKEVDRDGEKGHRNQGQPHFRHVAVDAILPPITRLGSGIGAVGQSNRRVSKAGSLHNFVRGS